MSKMIDKDENNIADDEWKCWCRLCAKEDAKNINIISEANQLSAPIDTTYSSTYLVDFIQEFFRINMRNEGDLPQLLCTRCLSLVSSLVKFVDHVKQVQSMYDTIRLSGEWKPIQLRMLRKKYNLLDDDIYTFKMLHQDVSPDKSVKSVIEKVFVDDVPESVIQNSLDTIVKSEVISDELQRELFPDEADHKLEFADPIGDGNENIDSDNESCDSESKISINKYLGIELHEPSGENASAKESKQKIRSSEAEQPDPKYFCVSCSLHFHRIGSYRVHMKKKHEMTKELFACPECPQSFNSKSKLNYHIQSHLKPEEKKIFPCPQCDRKFQSKYYVTKHIKFVHEDLRPFICEQCGEAVRTEAALREHMLTHTDYAPFECDVCKKGFKNQYRLKTHKEMHSAEKHICPECGMKLNSRRTLNRHMLVHSDVMPHKCDYCGRAFKRAKALKYHLIAHTGLRPYSCDFCEKTFSTGSSCRLHKKTMHPAELAALEASGAKAYTKNVPKLNDLKAIARTNTNFIPLTSKQDGYANARVTKDDAKSKADAIANI